MRAVRIGGAVTLLALVGFVFVSLRREQRDRAVANDYIRHSLFPEQASTFAKDVDALYFFILATCAFFAHRRMRWR